MKILGLKLSTWAQWLEVLRIESKAAPSLWQIFRMGLKLPFTPRRTWRLRMRGCGKCPIYSRATRQCKRGDLGCRCFMPVKAFIGPCWARELQPDGEIGWPKEIQ